jgi:hypothetical protein
VTELGRRRVALIRTVTEYAQPTRTVTRIALADFKKTDSGR